MDEMTRAVETYVGFHVQDGFWVGERLDLQDPELATRLKGIVPEITVYSATERFKALVCIDGLILLRVQHLAGSVPNMADPAEFDASVLWWREHLDYANTFQVCLESESSKCGGSSEIELAALRPRALTWPCRRCAEKTHHQARQDRNSIAALHGRKVYLPTHTSFQSLLAIFID